MGQINLLKETEQDLIEHGKTLDDIVWVGFRGKELPLDKFIDFADQLYSNSYGGNEVSMSLLVVGKDWWLERHEYDGSEWWEYKTLPMRPAEIAFSTTKEEFWEYPQDWM